MALIARAVFLDRDGVLNRAVVRDDKPYPPGAPGEVEILPGVADALRRLKALDYLLIVVTNQPDVARGKQPRERVEEINAWLKRRLPIDAFYVCYHDDADHCECRKPLPGLGVLLIHRHQLNPARCIYVGAGPQDPGFARKLGFVYQHADEFFSSC